MDKRVWIVVVGLILVAGLIFFGNEVKLSAKDGYNKNDEKLTKIVDMLNKGNGKEALVLIERGYLSGVGFQGGAPLCQQSFIRGDANEDDRVNIGDVIYILRFLFDDPQQYPLCLGAGDANDDESVDISDPIYLLAFLFNNGPQPPEPYPNPGFDPTGKCPVLETWEGIFGSALSDESHSIYQTDDCGYIVAGKTDSYGAGNFDGYLIKLDSDGSEEWSRTFGGFADDGFEFVQQTSDGGFILTGETSSFGGFASDFWIIKTDYLGIEEWSQVFDLSGIEIGLFGDEVFNIGGDSEGFIFTGFTSTLGGTGDIYLVRLDLLGGIIWDNLYGGVNSDRGFSVIQTSDGGFLVSGFYDSDAYALKLNSAGIFQWDNSFGGVGIDYFSEGYETQSGDFIFGGVTQVSGDNDGYLVKLNSFGDLMWEQTYGLVGISESLLSMVETQDQGYILAGLRINGDQNFYLVKTDINGNEMWSREYGGNGDDLAFSVKNTGDGGYAIAGSTDSLGAGSKDVYILKTDENGDI